MSGSRREPIISWGGVEYVAPDPLPPPTPSPGGWVADDGFDPRSLPAVAACYVLYLDGQLTYVGSAENLLERFRSHVRGPIGFPGRYSTPWGTARTAVLKYRPSRRYGDWLMVEARLIRRLRPPGNVRGVTRTRKVAG